jgi:hypothetical protein
VSTSPCHLFAASQYHSPCLLLVISRSPSQLLYHVKKQHCCSVIIHHLPVAISVLSRALYGWRFECFCAKVEHALIPICQVSAAVDARVWCFEGMCSSFLPQKGYTCWLTVLSVLTSFAFLPSASGIWHQIVCCALPLRPERSCCFGAASFSSTAEM